MIDVEVLRDRSIMIIRPGGRLDRSDFEHIEREFDQLPRLEGKINGLLIDARAFPGWSNRAAFARHIRFIKDHHSKVRRIAAVSDAIIFRIFAAIAKYFVSAELRYFSLYEKDRALTGCREVMTTKFIRIARATIYEHRPRTGICFRWDLNGR